MRVLVTGATGFLGSHTVRALRRDGHDVRVMVRTPAKAETLFARMAIDGCEIVPGDITDAASVTAAIAGCDAVVHAAAVVAIEPTRQAEMETTNLAGAKNVLGAAVAAGCSPIVHVSTVAALFPFQTDPVTADHPVVGAENGYGQTKAACERYARSLQDQGEPVVTIYPSGVVGPEDWNESINLNAVKLWIEKGFPVAGGYSSSWVDVRDVADVIAASVRPEQGSARLLCMGTYLTARAQVDSMSEAIGAPFKSMPLPKPIWWVWARLGDLAARAKIDLVLTSDAYDYVFNSAPGDDTATVSATGVVFRPIVDTWRDTFRWMYEHDMVPAKRIGVLAS
ncbi:MAG: NAD-dependent epimerase/dehydratase family protein [Actinomycetota bacterium]